MYPTPDWGHVPFPQPIPHLNLLCVARTLHAQQQRALTLLYHSSSCNARLALAWVAASASRDTYAEPSLLGSSPLLLADS